jgi:hypothetical protein
VYVLDGSLMTRNGLLLISSSSAIGSIPHTGMATKILD